MPDIPLRTALATHPEIDLAIVFGSVARGDARPDSDLDIAVQTREPLDATAKMRLIEDLACATGRAIDLIDLRTVGEPLLGQILKHGRRIRGDSADMVDLMRRHVFDTEDFLPYVERMLEERRKAWIG
jgi:predicted nucleotidyltransferase